MKTNTTRAILPLAILAGITAALASCSDGGGKDEPTYEECYVLVEGPDGQPKQELDCTLPGCESTPVCSSGCKAQKECSAVNTNSNVERMCLDGKCASTGPRTEDGTLRTGGIYVWHTFDKNVNVTVIQKKGYLITVHHAITSGGKAITCRDLLRMEDPDGGTNVIARTNGEVTQIQTGDLLLTRIENVPLADEATPHLLLSRFYSVSPKAAGNTTGEPGGLLYAKGCVDGVEVIEGPLPPNQDQAHSVDLTVSPACDVADPNSCPDGKQCVPGAGFCRYVCEGCTARETCRPMRPGEAPQCVLTCDPGRGVTCPLDERNTPRCDATPGEDPACLPD